jgi:hypothetical protein
MMKSMTTVFRGLAAALFLLLTGLNGCGYKTLPVAPQAMIPAPVRDLSYELTDKGVTLRWTYPAKTVTGKDVAEIDTFLLYRAVVPADDYCETCPIPFGPPLDLPGGILPDKGSRVGSHVETLLRPDDMYFFKIRSRTGWLSESEDSNLVSFVWQNPPAAPGGLTAEAKDGVISLRWQRVSSHLDGSPLKGEARYQVSRSTGGAAFATLGGVVSETVFADKKVEQGRKYAYRVQALAVHDKGLVGGGFSRTVEASPADETAPEPPAKVKAARTASAVKVYWDKGTEKDLAGHRIYRRVGEAAPEMIGEVKEPDNLFEDKNPPEKGTKVFYSVSSFDQSSPPNESQKSAEASVR